MNLFRSSAFLAASLFAVSATAFAAGWSVFEETPLSRMSKEDAESYRQAVIEGLERGEENKTINWQGKAQGASSKITPLKRYTEGELNCREIRLETRAGGLSSAGPYRLCKSSSGSWGFGPGPNKRAAKPAATK